MLNFLDKLLLFAFLKDLDLAVCNLNLQTLCGEGTTVADLLCIMGDINKAAGACQTGAELGYIQVAVRCSLSQTEECDVQTAALIEVKLYVVFQNCLCVCRCAELPEKVMCSTSLTNFFFSPS